MGKLSSARQHRLLFDAVLLGIIGAASAQIFTLLLGLSESVFLTGLAHYQPPGLPEEGGVLKEVIGSYGLWLIPVATTLGGLLSGLLVFTFAPEAEGHGTDTVVKAFHRAGGAIRARVPFLKLIASALTIGSGGAAGREGPTALITAGFGSVYAKFTKRSEAERRLLVLAGMGAGLSAIFRSPIGAALFAIEVLYGEMELEAGALLFTLLASVIAYALNGILVGWQPLFQFPPDLAVHSLSGYGWHAVLGLVSGGVAALIPSVFYGTRDVFRKIPVPASLLPAIGGLGVGLLALRFPQILGGGYGWIQEAIDGRIALNIAMVLLVAKLLAFSLTIGSGGSGGVFAPNLFLGAMLGAGIAQLTHHPSPAFVVVGMVALFGAAARVPIAALFMVTEMTGVFHMLVPAALAVTLSYLVQVALSPRLPYQSLYEAQVPRRKDSPAHYEEHLRAALGLLRRREITLPADIGGVDLVSLLLAGIPVELPGEKQLRLATLVSESQCVGKPLQSGCLTAGSATFEIVGLLRDEDFLLPESYLVLQADDRLLLITTRDTWDVLAEHVEPWSGPMNRDDRESPD